MIARGSGIRKGKGLDSGRPDQSAPVGQGSMCNTHITSLLSVISTSRSYFVAPASSLSITALAFSLRHTSVHLYCEHTHFIILDNTRTCLLSLSHTLYHVCDVCMYVGIESTRGKAGLQKWYMRSECSQTRTQTQIQIQIQSHTRILAASAPDSNSYQSSFTYCRLRLKLELRFRITCSHSHWCSDLDSYAPTLTQTRNVYVLTHLHT